MEEQNILLGYLEAVLGKSKSTARNNHSFMCPNGCHPSKHKLEINLDTGQFQCWICGGEKGGFKGKGIYNLLKQAKASKKILDEVKTLQPVNETKKQSSTEHKSTVDTISLPSEYKPLYNITNPSLIERHALVYLRGRGIYDEDIIKYNIGYCAEGKYKNRVIIPIYDKKGRLNYFVARSFDDSSLAYLNPQLSRDIIPNEYLINWNLPIILCEGIFDAIAIKRNVIPLLGKNIQNALMKKIVTSQVKKIYICLDKDAFKKALQFCEELLREDKEVYLIEMDDKDPSKMGFESFTRLIQTIESLTYSKIMEYKLSKI